MDDPPKILVVTTFENDEYVYRALRAGADGFLLKRARPEEIVHAVRLVAEGDSLLFPASVRRLAVEYGAGEGRGNRAARAALERARLTEREGEVLRLMARGLSNAEIAGRLVVGTETVKSHVSAVLAKLGGAGPHAGGDRGVRVGVRHSWVRRRGARVWPWGGRVGCRGRAGPCTRRGRVRRVRSGQHAHELGGRTVGRLTGGDPSLLRRINSAVVLHALRATDCATLTEITRVTGLSRPTVEGVVEDLIGAGLVVEKAAEEGAARRQGRPARRYRFRAEAGHLLGLEIGPHRVAALLSDLDGRVLGAQAREVEETADADERLDRLRGAVAELLRRAGVPRSSLRAVGAATPGIVEAGGTVRLGTALPGWTGLPLGERLSRSFKCPVLVENDANAAAVAEHWKGAGTESDDMVFVLAGLSPGAGGADRRPAAPGVRRCGRGDRRAASAGA
ncbi:hypothetical protein GCM10020256_67140 [Streptomyces thermocoprophilus]